MEMRTYTRGRDDAAMLDLVLGDPVANLHTADLPYRLCSWALDDPANVVLWDDARGRLAGWAVLQTPFWTIDFAFRHDSEADLLPRALEWADRRAAAAQATGYGHPSWYVNAFADQGDRLRQLEAAGYGCQADVGEDSWSRVLLERHAPPPSRGTLPDGFAIRPLAGEREVDAYVELHRATFESKNMTPAWRRRTLCSPHHRHETDLVLVAPDGRLAGFCIGWLTEGRAPVGQIEPMGIARLDRARGLGATLLGEGVRALLAAGAHRVIVETDTYRTPALVLYESLGFAPVRDVLVYRKDVAASSVGER